VVAIFHKIHSDLIDPKPVMSAPILLKIGDKCPHARCKKFVVNSVQGWNTHNTTRHQGLLNVQIVTDQQDEAGSAPEESEDDSSSDYDPNEDNGGGGNGGSSSIPIEDAKELKSEMMELREEISNLAKLIGGLCMKMKASPTDVTHSPTYATPTRVTRNRVYSPLSVPPSAHKTGSAPKPKPVVAFNGIAEKEEEVVGKLFLANERIPRVVYMHADGKQVYYSPQRATGLDVPRSCNQDQLLRVEELTTEELAFLGYQY
jgi:hypothetical protein